jgi:hypothetical protein
VETIVPGKIIHKQSPSYLHDLISIKDQKYNFRHQDKAVMVYNNTYNHAYKHIK